MVLVRFWDRNGVGILVDSGFEGASGGGCELEVYRSPRKLSLVEILMGHIGQRLMALTMFTRLWFWGEKWGWNFASDFAKAFELVIANSCFPKENHMVTFQVIEASRSDRKVIPVKILLPNTSFGDGPAIKRDGGRRLYPIDRGLSGVA
ncbi:hypothetical protein H5410_063824 [Solanum commersonii]|uniref:Uncharacterized protein n=1 Tax=Solanum commersonii TaxID=4109 RepID=A0A9J5WEL3_SOLCO|nr:hypothetical protein H5410_063824 [Solanum commersonii]